MHMIHVPVDCDVFYWTAVNGFLCNIYWALLAIAKKAESIVTFPKNVRDIALACEKGLSTIVYGRVQLRVGGTSFLLSKY